MVSYLHLKGVVCYTVISNINKLASLKLNSSSDQLPGRFTNVIHDRDRGFFPAKPLQPCLIFTSKVGAYPSESVFRCSTLRQALGIAKKRSTGLARDKHSSLFGTLKNRGNKQFYNFWHRIVFIKGKL
jgi:hypothetical protein